MNRFLKYIRFFTALFSLLAGLSITAVIIYFYSDYERHVMLNTNVDDYTIGFMFMVVGIAFFISILFFIIFFNQVKREKVSKTEKRV